MATDSQPTSPPSDPRVLFAAERTLLAWIRTGVSMMGFGFVIARFGLFLRELAAANPTGPAHQTFYSSIVGTSMIALGAIVSALAAAQHIRFVKRYAAGQSTQPHVVSIATILAAIICLAGLGLAAYLLVV